MGGLAEPSGGRDPCAASGAAPAERRGLGATRPVRPPPSIVPLSTRSTVTDSKMKIACIGEEPGGGSWAGDGQLGGDGGWAARPRSPGACQVGAQRAGALGSPWFDLSSRRVGAARRPDPAAPPAACTNARAPHRACWIPRTRAAGCWRPRGGRAVVGRPLPAGPLQPSLSRPAPAPLQAPAMWVSGPSSSRHPCRAAAGAARRCRCRLLPPAAALIDGQATLLEAGPRRSQCAAACRPFWPALPLALAAASPLPLTPPLLPPSAPHPASRVLRSSRRPHDGHGEQPAVLWAAVSLGLHSGCQAGKRRRLTACERAQPPYCQRRVTRPTCPTSPHLAPARPADRPQVPGD